MWTTYIFLSTVKNRVSMTATFGNYSHWDPFQPFTFLNPGCFTRTVGIENILYKLSIAFLKQDLMPKKFKKCASLHIPSHTYYNAFLSESGLHFLHLLQVVRHLLQTKASALKVLQLNWHLLLLSHYSATVVNKW